MEQRIANILKILLNQASPITVEEICTSLNVSNKTIRIDLAKASEYCQKYDLILEKKTGVGVSLIGSIDGKLALKSYITTDSNIKSKYSLSERRFYIALRILTAEAECTVSSLSNELFISQSVIRKDIESIKPYFTDNKVTINYTKHGIITNGKERHKRDLIFKFMREDSNYIKLSSILQNPKYICNDSFIYPALDYTDSNFQHLFKTVLLADTSLFNILSFDRLLTLMLRIFITVMRLSSDHYVTLSENFMKQLKTNIYQNDALAISKNLEEAFKIKFTQDEINYLQVHIISITTEKPSSTSLDENVLSFVNGLIHGWTNKYNYPFEDDQNLFASLYQHCKPILTRFRHAIPVENPLLNTIKANYTDCFNQTKSICSNLQKKYDCIISDEEIGYLTLHLINTLDKRKVPLNALLITEYGYGVTNLLIQKINKFVPYLQITDHVDILQFHDVDFTNYDYILLTTVVQQSFPIPYSVISPIVTEDDLIQLDRMCYSLYIDKNKD